MLKTRSSISAPRGALLVFACLAFSLGWPLTATAEPPGHGEHRGHAEAGAGHGESGEHAEHAEGHGQGHHTKHLENWFSLSFGPGKKYQNGPFAFMILNFVLLLWLLVKFARKPFSEYLQNRHATIRDDLKEAARMREDARLKLTEIQAKLDNLDREIEEIKEHVAKDAQLEKERIIKAAEEEAERLILAADKTLDQDLRRARRMLEAEAVTAAMTAAEKLIKQKMDESDHKRLNDEYFKQIASSGGSN